MFILTFLTCFHVGPVDVSCHKFAKPGFSDFKECSEMVAPYRNIIVDLAETQNQRIVFLGVQCQPAEAA